MSGSAGGSYVTLTPSAIGRVLTNNISGAVYFPGVDLKRDHGVVTGDIAQFELFGNPSIDGERVITGITVIDTGSYIFVAGGLPDDLDPSGRVNFFSQFNLYNDFGLGMLPEEIDIDKHLELKESFLATYDVRFYLRDTLEDVKDFIEAQLYKPIGCYSLPSDKQGLSRLSVGINLPPLPIEQIQEIGAESIIKPENIKQRRSANKYHYNAVVFKYEDTVNEEDLNRTIVSSVGTQIVPTGNKVFRIEAKGFRDGFGATQFASVIATRILNRYSGAAEEYAGIEVTFSKGILVNIGDVVIFNPEGLNVLNRRDQSRNKPAALLECINKTTDIKGKTTLTLIDTNFDINARVGLVSPASRIVKANSGVNFLIQHWNGQDFSGFGATEGQKWTPLLPVNVLIHNADFSLMHSAVMISVSDNIVEVDNAPSFTITDGDFFIKLDSYEAQKQSVKLVYTFLNDGFNAFSDGQPPYTFFG